MRKVALITKAIFAGLIFSLPTFWPVLWPISIFSLAYFYYFLIKIYNSEESFYKQFLSGFLWAFFFLVFIRFLKQRGLLIGLSELLPSQVQNLSAYTIYILMSSYLIIVFAIICSYLRFVKNCYVRWLFFTLVLVIADSFQTSFFPEYLDHYLYFNDIIASASGFITETGIKIIFVASAAIFGEYLLSTISLRKAAAFNTIIVIVLISASSWHVYNVDKSRTNHFMKVILVQTNISTYSKNPRKIDLDEIAARINKSFPNSQETVDIFFPEYSFIYEGKSLSLIKNFQKKITFPTRIHLGFSEYVANGIKNTIAGFSSDGRIMYRYDKQRLFPIGEESVSIPFIPSSWSRTQIPIIKGKADQKNVFQFEKTAMIPLICYESSIDSLFGERVRQAQKYGAKNVYFTSFSKDSYLENTPTLDQWSFHAKRAAAKYKKYILRVSTTEYTEVVSPSGRIVASLPAHTEGVLALKLPLYEF